MSLNAYNKFETLPSNAVAVMGWSRNDERYLYLYDLDKCNLYEGKYTFGTTISGDNLKLITFTLIYDSTEGKIRKLSNTTTRFVNYDALLIVNRVYAFRLSIEGLAVSCYTVHCGQWVDKPIVSFTPITCVSDIVKNIKPMYEKLIDQDTTAIKNTFAIAANNNTNNKKECC
jgi:hypothetical protein